MSGSCGGATAPAGPVLAALPGVGAVTSYSLLGNACCRTEGKTARPIQLRCVARLEIRSVRPRPWRGTARASQNTHVRTHSTGPGDTTCAVEIPSVVAERLQPNILSIR